MEFVDDIEKKINSYMEEIEGDVTVTRLREMEGVLVPLNNLLKKKVPEIVERLNLKRKQLREDADNIYMLMDILYERCGKLPQQFCPGIIKQTWHLGVKCPKKQLEKSIQHAIKKPNFNYKQFEENLNKAIDKANIIAKLLDDSEKKFLSYTGKKSSDWIYILDTFRGEIDDELKLYIDIDAAKEALRPGARMTDKWFALVKYCRK